MPELFWWFGLCLAFVRGPIAALILQSVQTLDTLKFRAIECRRTWLQGTELSTFILQVLEGLGQESSTVKGKYGMKEVEKSPEPGWRQTHNILNKRHVVCHYSNSQSQRRNSSAAISSHLCIQKFSLDSSFLCKTKFFKLDGSQIKSGRDQIWIFLQFFQSTFQSEKLKTWTSLRFFGWNCKLLKATKIASGVEFSGCSTAVERKYGRFLVSGPNERSGTEWTGPINGPVPSQNEWNDQRNGTVRALNERNGFKRNGLPTVWPVSEWLHHKGSVIERLHHKGMVIERFERLLNGPRTVQWPFFGPVNDRSFK